MGQLNLRVLIQVVDKATKPVRDVARGLNNGLSPALRGANGLGGRFGRVLGVIGTVALAKTLPALTLVARGLGKLIGLGIRAAGVLTGVGLAAASAFTSGVFKAGSHYETLERLLTTTEGSASAARETFGRLDAFAAAHGLNVEALTAAYIELRNRGIDVTEARLLSLGNAAAGSGKSIVSASEAVRNATQGQMSGLEEFGIRAEEVGNRIAFTYQKAGQTVRVEARNNARAIERTVMSIFNNRFDGALAQQAASLSGLGGRLMAELQTFKRGVADAGVFDYVKVELAGFLALIEKAKANGDLAKWTKEISGGLIQLLGSLKDLVTKVDWVGFTTSVINVTNGFVDFMNKIGGIETLITTVVAGGIGWLTTAFMGLGATIAAMLGVAAAPIVGTIAIIGLLATAAWFVYRNWDAIVAKLKELWNGFVTFMGGIWDGVKRVFTAGVDQIWKGLPLWFRHILTGAGFVLKIATNAVNNVRPGGPDDGPGGNGGGRPRPAPPSGGSAANGQVAVDVRVHQDGRPATVTARSTSPQVPVSTMSQYRGANGR